MTPLEHNPLREVRVYRDFSIRQGKAEYLAYRPGEEKWSLRAKTITELKGLIDCLIESDAEAAQPAPAAASAPEPQPERELFPDAPRVQPRTFLDMELKHKPQPAAAASAPVLCLNCGQPANRGDFALCWDCEYDFRSAASDEPPPAPEADETTDELLHIIHKEYGIRADKLILEREELAAQLATSQERERDLRAALDVSPFSFLTLIGRLDEIHHLDLTDNQQFALGYVIGFLYRLDSLSAASEEASDGG